MVDALVSSDMSGAIRLITIAKKPTKVLLIRKAGAYVLHKLQVGYLKKFEG
jgi:hypothetical protein